MAKWTTTRNVLAAVALATAMLPALAQKLAPGRTEEPAFPLPPDQDLLADLPDGAHLETRRNGDINGDGIPDVAFVGGNETERWLAVKIGYKDELDWGFEPVSVNKGLDAYPLGAAGLSVKKNVLIVEDLTGGTTATNAVYRYRWDPQRKRMQLIGLDAERYSRTNAHDSFKISWNLLTGAHETVRGILNQHPKGDDDAAYFPQKPVRSVHETQPVYMEDTPNPDDLIDAEVVPAGEDRD